MFSCSLHHMVDIGGFVLMPHNTLSTALEAGNYEAFSILLEKLTNCNSCFIINTLIDVLGVFNSKPTDGPLAKPYEQCCDLLNKQISKLESFKLTMNGLTDNQEMLETCYSMISSNKVTEIELLGSQSCFSNIKNPMQLISILLKNTSVTQCQLSLSYDQGDTTRKSKIEEPLIVLLDLILKRNREIAICKSPIFQDNIYNQYVKPINQLIEQITPYTQYTFRGKSFEKISSLEETRLYTLKELACFTIFNLNQPDMVNELKMNDSLVMKNDAIEDLIKLKK